MRRNLPSRIAGAIRDAAIAVAMAIARAIVAIFVKPPQIGKYLLKKPKLLALAWGGA